MTNSIIDDVTQKAWELDVGDDSRPPAVTRERYTWWVQHVFRAAEELGYEITKPARPTSAELFEEVRAEVEAERREEARKRGDDDIRDLVREVQADAREQREAELSGTYPHGLGNDGEPF